MRNRNNCTLQKLKRRKEHVRLIFYTVLLIIVFFIDTANTDTEITDVLNTLDISQCFIDAGNRYNIHPNLLWAIAKVESGFNPYAINRNSNGTYDIGIMQINTSWIPVLKKYGYNEKHLWNACYNIYVGAWVLAQCISKHGYTWEAVGCYNASSKVKRIRYSRKVYQTLKPYLE